MRGRAQETSRTEGSLDPAGEGCRAVPRLGPVSAQTRLRP